MPNSNPHTIRSLAKALSLMDVMAQKRRPMTLMELAEATGCPRSTIHTLLATLREYHYVSQDGEGRYVLGTHLFELGCAVSENWNISRLARPHLELLSARCGATSLLSFLEAERVINIDQCSGRGGIYIMSEVGNSLPLHATAQGKLMLSLRSDSEVRRLLNLNGMPAYTPHTITDPDTMITALDRIRAEGYSIENGELKIGLRTISAPVRDHEGRAAYCVSVVGLFRKIESDEFRNALSMVCATAEQISAELGCFR